MGTNPTWVRAWHKPLVIPTYTVGPPDRNPMFLNKRVYQGSSGVVYPHPVIDRIVGERVDRTYTAVFLENPYLKILVLPELGGRVQMALDKTNGYHFVYYNRVIKPALVGLCGPWISGGIEFNWPQHHRPSTFEPLDWTIETHHDGAATVWCAELERMFRTRGRHGFTLYPDRAFLEVRVHLTNRTAEPQTFLWWANPAVHVHDEYRSVFPPDVHAVMDHGKRAVSDFPIATGTYYRVNYAPGTDISRYSTIPVPTSYMAYHSDYDFLGCYDDRARAGLLHVADHHVVPGKKQWTWGNGEFGWAWDRQLTDEDGPYIELMCGAFTDNQPDFTWIMPGEEKAFTQYFFPYKEIGPPKNASREVAVNLAMAGNEARVGVHVTSPREVRIRLRRGEAVLLDTTERLAPETAYTRSQPLPAGVKEAELTLEVFSADRRLIAYTPKSEEPPPIPEPATAAHPPAEIATNEELYLNGLHLEQYRHASYAPERYYEEALRRDPDDSRCNTALGRRLLHAGAFAESEPYFRRAIRRLTARNSNPYDGDPFYHLGRCLRFLDRDEEAYAAFAKASWNDAWKAASTFEMARIRSCQGDLDAALEHLDALLSQAAHHQQGTLLRIALLRRLGRSSEARDLCTSRLALDPLDFGAVREARLLGLAPGPDGHFRLDATNALELALDYAHAGLWEDAVDVLHQAPPGDLMVGFLAAWVLERAGRPEDAQAERRRVRGQSPAFFFPNQLECVPVLESAIRSDPAEWRAWYGLGNFLYAQRRSEAAIACWERCAAIEPTFPTAHRNLGLAHFNVRQDGAKALEALETAFGLDPSDARVFFELDQLHKRLGHSPEERLRRLSDHRELLALRDDLTIEFVALLNAAGRHEEALSILLGRTYHPWEGGEGKPTGQYVQAQISLAREHLRRGRAEEAIACLTRARIYPPNLGEGKLPGARETDHLYWLGEAHARRGDREQARAYWEEAAAGDAEPAEARYYNDQPPETSFYQGLALRRLCREDDARARFERLLEFGRAHLGQLITIDYFAVSLPDFLVFEDDLRRRNDIHCHYLQGLGHLGLGEHGDAVRAFDAALSGDPNHLGARLHRAMAAEPATS